MTKSNTIKDTKAFRLLDFNVYDGQVDESGSSDDGGSKWKKKEFIVEYYGIDEDGTPVSAIVTGYEPFFFVKVPDNWGDGECFMLRDELKSPALTDVRIVKGKNLYGFDAGREYKFAKISFSNMSGFNNAKGKWYQEARGGDRRLIKGGLQIAGARLPIYEAHVPPLLRQFHIRDISPSGWVEVQLNMAIEREEDEKKTTCKYEYVVDYRHINPLNDKETPVPYNVMSFDIEASSSHGDFPLPIKDYKKLAENIADYVEKNGGHIMPVELTGMIRGAFGYGSWANKGDYVDPIYTEMKPSEKQLDAMIKKLLTTQLADMKDDDEGYRGVRSFLYRSAKQVTKPGDAEGGDNDSDDEEDAEDVVRKNSKPSHKVICELLTDAKMPRMSKVEKLVQLFRSCGFPKVLGDKVTFIGSTFRKSGASTQYLNHCIVLGTCDVPEGDNVVIESYDTEREVLLAWTQLMKREDPDIIIGYNIFGFDYEFMFRRAVECNCAEEFLELSRIKDKVCGKYVKGAGGNRVLDIEQSSVQIASGQHDFHYVKMEGRIQIDMLNYLRRDYNLTSYKLDAVASEFIGDTVKSIVHTTNSEGEAVTRVNSKNLVGLEKGNYVSFEEIGHSSDFYKEGAKLYVCEVNAKEQWFAITGTESPDMSKKVKWGLAKDDVSPQDIFRLTNGSSADRSIIAKYCLQDCNLVHHLLKKIDVVTGCVEMARISSVPISFIVFRGQGIKLTSYLAKECRELGFMKPTIDRGSPDDVYEGAIVLQPKVGFYSDNPVACLDYASLYPSEMIADNISHDSKVWTKTYDTEGALVAETGVKDKKGNYVYDNLPGYEYVDIEFDNLAWRRPAGKSAKAKPVKTVIGKKVCRFAQFPEGKKGVLPSILQKLLAQRKATRKESARVMDSDPQFANVLDKRQLSYKILANSIYGQTGAKTSSFYEMDIAASTTAGGRMMLMYAKRMLETSYINRIFDVPGYGPVKTNAEYVYGDTDSVFFTFNLMEVDGTPIRGQRALELTILLAQDAGVLASSFLKGPHDLEYEKTFMPFCLLSKKRYVGMLYETDPHKCYRKSMGIVLKRRDNAPIVKDVYGGVIDILMRGDGMPKAISFTEECLDQLVKKQVPINKLVITKSLRSGYKNPQQIAHKVLADRIGVREPGNKPAPGSRIAFAYIVNPTAKKQGEKIETPEYIDRAKCKLDYGHYITNQIMKPLSQVLGLCIEELPQFARRKQGFLDRVEQLRAACGDDHAKSREAEQKLRDGEVKRLFFDQFIKAADRLKNHQRDLPSMFGF